MSTDTISDFHYMAGSRMSFPEIVRAWLAFRELRARKAIWTSFCGREMQNAERAGWDLGVWVWGSTRERRYLERMDADPFDFFRGYEFGLDVGTGQQAGALIHPEKFAAVLDKARSDSGEAPAKFGEAEVARWADHFAARLREEARTQEARETSVKSTMNPPASVSNRAPQSDGRAAARSEGTIGRGLLWMVLICCLLFWIPIIGPFVAGLVGGKKSGGVGNALVAVFLPALVIGVILSALATALSGAPLIGVVAGGGAVILVLASVGPLLVGAIIGGLFA